MLGSYQGFVYNYHNIKELYWVEKESGDENDENQVLKSMQSNESNGYEKVYSDARDAMRNQNKKKK